MTAPIFEQTLRSGATVRAFIHRHPDDGDHVAPMLRIEKLAPPDNQRPPITILIGPTVGEEFLAAVHVWLANVQAARSVGAALPVMSGRQNVVKARPGSTSRSGGGR